MPRSRHEEAAFKYCHFDQDVIVLCVRWYVSYRLSYRDLVEMVAVKRCMVCPVITSPELEDDKKYVRVNVFGQLVRLIATGLDGICTPQAPLSNQSLATVTSLGFLRCRLTVLCHQWFKARNGEGSCLVSANQSTIPVSASHWPTGVRKIQRVADRQIGRHEYPGG